MFVQVKVGLVLRVRGSDPMTTLGRGTLFFCLGYIPHPPGTSTPDFLLKFRILKTQCGTAMMRILSPSVCKKTLIYPDFRLSDLVEL